MGVLLHPIKSTRYEYSSISSRVSIKVKESADQNPTQSVIL